MIWGFSKAIPCLENCNGFFKSKLMESLTREWLSIKAFSYSLAVRWPFGLKSQQTETRQKHSALQMGILDYLPVCLDPPVEAIAASKKRFGVFMKGMKS